jgi:hypothetical protein
MDHTSMYHLNEREFDDWCFGKITIEPAIYEYQPLFRMIAAINILFGAVTMGCGTCFFFFFFYIFILFIYF